MKHLTHVRHYTDFKTLLEKEPEAIQALINEFNIRGSRDFDKLTVYDWRNKQYTPIEEIEDLIEMIREGGNNTESTDRNYIYNDYEIQVEGFNFSVSGSSYRKDQSICDEEMDDTVTVVDVNMFKEEKRKNEEQHKNENIQSWNAWFENKSIEQMKEYLLTTKFPKNLK